MWTFREFLYQTTMSERGTLSYDLIIAFDVGHTLVGRLPEARRRLRE